MWTVTEEEERRRSHSHCNAAPSQADRVEFYPQGHLFFTSLPNHPPPHFLSIAANIWHYYQHRQWLDKVIYTYTIALIFIWTLSIFVMAVILSYLFIYSSGMTILNLK